MNKWLFSFALLLSMPVFSQVVVRPVNFPRPVIVPRPVLTPVQVKVEYRGARLTNRGLYYINNQKNISHYFADEGDSETTLGSLSGKAQAKFAILQNEIRQFGEKFNPNALKDLIDSAYESGYRDGAMAVDIDALVMLIMAGTAKEADQELKGMLEEMEKLNRQKRQNREYLKGLKAKLTDCMRTNNCPVQARLALEVQIKNATQKQNELDDMSESMQLRLQAYSDRRAKIMEALSNLLKKISETAQGIVQNIK